MVLLNLELIILLFYSKSYCGSLFLSKFNSQPLQCTASKQVLATLPYISSYISNSLSQST
jgi:hypothetical protein